MFDYKEMMIIEEGIGVDMETKDSSKTAHGWTDDTVHKGHRTVVAEFEHFQLKVESRKWKRTVD